MQELDAVPVPGHPPDVPLVQDLQAAVEDFCRREGISYAELARRAGMHREALSRALAAGREGAARKGVSIETAERIAKEIGLRVALVPAAPEKGGRS